MLAVEIYDNVLGASRNSRVEVKSNAAQKTGGKPLAVRHHNSHAPNSPVMALVGALHEKELRRATPSSLPLPL